MHVHLRYLKAKRHDKGGERRCISSACISRSLIINETDHERGCIIDTRPRWRESQANGITRRGNSIAQKKEKESTAACQGTIGLSQPPPAPADGDFSFPCDLFLGRCIDRGTRIALGGSANPRHPSRGASPASISERERETRV